MKTFVLTILAILSIHNISRAQYSEYVDMNEEATVTADSPVQAQDLGSQQVIESIVQKFVVDLVGEKKYEANKNLIKNQILKESGKFAPVVKPTVQDLGNNQYKVTVALKVSPQNLRQLLEKTGLLASQFESGIALPFVGFVDEVRAKTYKWWVGEPIADEFLKSLNRSLSDNLRKSMRSMNFFVIDPVQWEFKKSLPVELQKDYFRKEDYQFIESYYNFPLVIRGQVDIVPSARVSTSYKFQVKLEAVLNSQGKVIAEASRQFETQPGEMQAAIQKTSAQTFAEVSTDLKEQIDGALRKGLLESSVINLTLRGNLNYKNLETFKSTLLKSIGSVRNLTERFIESGQRVFEVDYTGNVQELANKIEALKYAGIKVSTQDVSAKNISLKITN